MASRKFTAALLAFAICFNGMPASLGDFDIDGDVEDEISFEDEASVANANISPTENKESIKEEAATIGPATDVHTSFLFTEPENSTDLIGGKPTKFLIGFQNRGDMDFIVRYCEGSFRYVAEYSFVIQNFSVVHYDQPVGAKLEATFEFAFVPSDQFAGRPVMLVVLLRYEDTSGKAFVSTVFNDTVNMIEDESSFNTETGFLYLLFAAAVVLALLTGQHFLSKLTRKHGMTKGRQQQVIEMGTANKNEVDFRWIPDALINHGKSPKVGPSIRHRKPHVRQ